MKKNTKETSKVKKTPKINNSNEFRSQFIKRVVTYSFFGLLTIVLSILIFYRAKGYTFTKTGQVEKRGIVLIDSAPVSAKIFLDGKEIAKTDSKLEVTEGEHDIRLEAEGYKTWQRSFTMGREKVVWFYYPYLIPESLKSEPFIANQIPRQYSRLSSDGEIVSMYRSTLNQRESINLELLSLKEEDSAKATKPLIVPSSLLTRQANATFGEIQFTDWSPNGDSIYLKHNFDGKSEIINLRVNNPSESQNLTRLLGPDIKEVHYDSRSRIYALVGSEVALYEPKTLVKEQSITTNATGFQVFADNKFVYTQNLSSAGTSLFVQDGQNAPIKVADYETLDINNFDYKYIINRRTPYLAVTNLANKELKIFKDPLDTRLNLPTTTSDNNLPVPLYFATFSDLKSANIEDSPGSSSQPGNYLALQLSGAKFFIYDFDEESSFSYNLSLKNQPEKTLDFSSYRWLDSHRLQGKTVDGEVYYFDYDGNYLNLIGSTNEELSYFIKSRNRVFLVNNLEPATNQINFIKLKI